MRVECTVVVSFFLNHSCVCSCFVGVIVILFAEFANGDVVARHEDVDSGSLCIFKCLFQTLFKVETVRYNNVRVI